LSSVEPSSPVERALPSGSSGSWGSDALAEIIRALEIPYIALNPGASFRGLHDSLVNHLGNERPKLLLCLHEETAVAIAHGWAKVTEEPMLVTVHANVALMHAAMGIFNAWVDRVPVVVLGTNGPMDAAKRRPWIDWIHSTKDQGQLVRDFTKWDDQPLSVKAAYESILRARQIAATAPYGPTYVALDVSLQEEKLDGIPALPDVSRFLPPAPVAPSAALAEDAARRLLRAQRPLILMGRVSRGEAAWAGRVALAEAVGAVVLTDLKAPAAFPSDHPLLGAAPFKRPGRVPSELIREADVLMSLDWIDLAGTLQLANHADAAGTTIINVSLDRHLHNGYTQDSFGLPPVDLAVMAEPDPTVAAILEAVRSIGARTAPAWPARTPVPKPAQAAAGAGGAITTRDMAAALQTATAGRKTCLIRYPISWASGQLWPIAGPLDFLGDDGGGGIGSAAGMAVGAALALKGTDRLPIAVVGDGDYLMTSNAVWTAVHYRIPLLMVLANNRSYYQDERHQQTVARDRGREIANAHIGLQINDPPIDLALIARAQGARTFGPIARFDELEAALARAVEAVAGGETVVVDVLVEPSYTND
jgi:thiamine pyrophosphate-dependent acetolactate synthase large subunit-like protein